MKNGKYITNEIKVWSEYARELGDNNKDGDQRICLNIAPVVNGDAEYLYIDTNGNSSMVGWLDDGEVVYTDDALGWLDNEAWIKEAIEDSVFA